MNLKKPYDPGQKYRTLKNMSRFFRNPFGFMLWRHLYAVKQNRGLGYIKIKFIIL
jgi:hypothetical protein